MTVAQRRIVYIFFFLLFFIIAPLLLLYASGYRWDLTSWRISKVGALYIKTYPSGARVYRDNQYTKRKTPTQIVNMPAGKHSIVVVKDDYQPWSKELRIEAGKTTFVEDIVLFKQNFERLTLGAGGKKLLLSPDGELAAYANNRNQLAITNLIAGTIDNSISLPSNSQLERWSHDRERIAFETRGQWSIVDLGSHRVWSLSTYVKSTISTVHFGSSGDDVWLLTSGSLWRLNLLTGKKQLIADGIKDFYATADEQLWLTQDNRLVEAKGTVSNRQEYQLPKGDYKTISDFRQATALLASDNQFFIWRNGQLQDTIKATQFDWRKNKILLTNGYDIWRYDTDDVTTALLDRSSVLPQILRWHPSQSYITLLVDGRIQIMELDSRGEKRHRIEITDQLAKDFTFDPKGEKIFILTDKDFSLLRIQ